MKALFKEMYRYLVSKLKAFDKATGYIFGNIFRELTNVNTRKYWDKMFGENDDFLRNYRYRPLLGFLPSDRVFSLLDIGCAVGSGPELLKKNFPKARISGADISSVGIEKARLKTRDIDYFVLDILKESPPQKYDFITIIHTLEHVNDPLAVVDKCLRFVNEALIICTPYEKEIDNPRLYWSSEHRYLFNEDSFKNYNFEILKIGEHEDVGRAKYILYKLMP